MIAHALIALARVAERRARTSPFARTNGRRALYLLTRVSREARAFLRLRIMPIV